MVKELCKRCSGEVSSLILFGSVASDHKEDIMYFENFTASRKILRNRGFRISYQKCNRHARVVASMH